MDHLRRYALEFQDHTLLVTDYAILEEELSTSLLVKFLIILLQSILHLLINNCHAVFEVAEDIFLSAFGAANRILRDTILFEVDFNLETMLLNTCSTEDVTASF